MKPQDSLFNWPIRKDPQGTKKNNLLKIVTPPSTSSRPLVQKRKRPKPSKTRCGVAAPAPPKLILHPDFWSQPKTDPKWRRKQRISFPCRKNAECQEQFSSIRDREVHEGICLSFDQVFICIFVFDLMCIEHYFFSYRDIALQIKKCMRVSVCHLIRYLFTFSIYTITNVCPPVSLSAKPLFIIHSSFIFYPSFRDF